MKMSAQQQAAKNELAACGECRSADDLFQPPARRLIYCLMTDFFVKNKVTVTEALHRAEILGKLENAGTVLQHAFQKIAVARSAANGTPITETIRTLDKLTSELYARVYNDKRADVFPTVEAEGFGALAEKLASQENGAYLLNGALATYLRDGSNWNEKAVRLTRLVEMHRTDGPGRVLLHGAIDEILAEILYMPSALQDIVGPKEYFGDALTALMVLFLGKEQTGQYGEGQALTRLAGLFAAGEMPAAHRSLAARIIGEIYSLKRLRTDSYEAELKQFKQITALAMHCVGAHMTRETLTATLEHRAKRFVEPKCLSECLAATTLPDGKIEWLLFAADCIIGADNKAACFNAIVRILASALFANQMNSPQVPVLKRLHRLAALNSRVRSSSFAPALRGKIANILDVNASDLAARSRIFESIDGRNASPADKAMLLAKLISAGTFTEPRLAAKTRETIIDYLARPSFLEDYETYKLQTFGKKLDDAAAAADLAETLKTVGIAPDDCRKAIAA